ncbi:MAG: sugar-binding domain-containing protein, partial [Bacteroidota bacterium]
MNEWKGYMKSKAQSIRKISPGKVFSDVALVSGQNFELFCFNVKANVILAYYPVNMKIIPLILTQFLLLNFINTFAQTNLQTGRLHDFNENWLYSNDSTVLGQETSLEDRAWRTIDLPHDISIEDLAIQNAQNIGPFFKGVKRGGDVGYVKGGVAWYRKHFTLTNEQAGKEVILHFDGVQSESEVFVNGILVNENRNGYTPFNITITDHLNDPGKDNLISVKVRNREMSSR